MSSCCSSPPPESPTPEVDDSSCCGGTSKSCDWLLWGSLFFVLLGYFGHLFFADLIADASTNLAHYCRGVFELFNKMWWGLGLGVLAVGSLGWMPREWVASALGKPGTINGIFRAIFAGLFLDLCNHGILLVAMKLYERGASYGQTLAFLIASPWNSLSLTLVLIALIGIKWTLGFILLSVVVAVVTGLVVEILVKNGHLPANNHSVELPEGFKLWPEMKEAFKKSRLSHILLVKMVKSGLSESQMIVRWIFFGTVLAAAIRAFVPIDVFGDWFGPTWTGVMLTLVAATVIEVCSEGSSPIAADLVTRANAPGNGFAFLMAGAATDYTEIMALKETTRSWKMAFILPMCTLPQVVVIAWMVNSLA